MKRIPFFMTPKGWTRTDWIRRLDVLATQAEQRGDEHEASQLRRWRRDLLALEARQPSRNGNSADVSAATFDLFENEVTTNVQ